ncbi:MAG: hypothetical protein M3R69_15845 [Acidobacteriota bacterium]|nr:hypothetical protein [Acidobacteriota bacterium]
MSVPSLVSINNRGPLSGSASAGGGLVIALAVALLLVERLFAAVGLLSDFELSSVVGWVSALLRVAVSSDFAGWVGRVLPLAGRRPRLFPGDGFAPVVLCTSSDDSAGLGAGVGAAATTEIGGAGSSILAPTDETRLPLVLLEVVADAAV